MMKILHGPDGKYTELYLQLVTDFLGVLQLLIILLLSAVHLNSFPEGANWPEGLQQINDLLPNGKFTSSVIYEVKYYEGPDPAVSK